MAAENDVLSQEQIKRMDTLTFGESGVINNPDWIERAKDNTSQEFKFLISTFLAPYGNQAIGDDSAKIIIDAVATFGKMRVEGKLPLVIGQTMAKLIIDCLNANDNFAIAAELVETYKAFAKMSNEPLQSDYLKDRFFRRTAGKVSGATCTLCLEAIQFSRRQDTFPDLVLTKCGHDFHKACWENYVAHNTGKDELTCPECRIVENLKST